MSKIIIEDGVRVYLDKNDEVLKVHFNQPDKLPDNENNSEDPDQCPKRDPGRHHSFVPRDDDPDYVYCEYCGVIES